MNFGANFISKMFKLFGEVGRVDRRVFVQTYFVTLDICPKFRGFFLPSPKTKFIKLTYVYSRLCRGLWSLDKSEPTFSEFIQFLTRTDVSKYDEHWQPVALRCR